MAFKPYQREELLRLAAAVEALSEHPIGTSHRSGCRKSELYQKPRHSRRQWVPESRLKLRVIWSMSASLHREENPQSVASQIADRWRKEGKTAVTVQIDNQPAGLLAIADALKRNSAAAVKRLRELNIRSVMLTGDNKLTAQFLAEEAGIDEVIAELSPEQKQKEIVRMQKAGAKVAMAGDGINDAPALAAADVGIAMGTGTEVAIESAGVTLVKGDLDLLVSAILLSRATMKSIRQNLMFAFVYNILGVPIAAGVLYPVFGLSAESDDCQPGNVSQQRISDR